MQQQFNAAEVFEIAQQIESDGAVFYRAAAELYGQGIVCDTLLKLADWEIEHKNKFTEMQKNIPAQKQLKPKHKAQRCLQKPHQSQRYQQQPQRLKQQKSYPRIPRRQPLFYCQNLAHILRETGYIH